MSVRMNRIAPLLLAIATAFAGFALMPSDAAAADGEEAEWIVINKKTNKLGYFRDGELVREFDVATGRKPEYTPEGTFEIVNKIKNRPYYKEKIPGGDPRNPLGDRWLGLDARDTPGTTYAIHGNNDPDSIGKYVSAGCVRMHNDEVHWLFDEVEVGTKVTIATSREPLEAIAAASGYAVAKTFEGKLVVDGGTMALSRGLTMYKGRVYLPLRECFELLGGTVDWDGRSNTVTVETGGRAITYVPGSGMAVVDGEVHAVTQSRKKDGAVMMPLRDMGKLAGYDVQWDAKEKAVILSVMQ